MYGAVVAVHARDASKHQHQVSRCSIDIAALRLDEPASGGCNIGGVRICSTHLALMTTSHGTGANASRADAAFQ